MSPNKRCKIPGCTKLRPYGYKWCIDHTERFLKVEQIAIARGFSPTIPLRVSKNYGSGFTIISGQRRGSKKGHRPKKTHEEHCGRPIEAPDLFSDANDSATLLELTLNANEWGDDQ